jgi:hypothetical protein
MTIDESKKEEYFDYLDELRESGATNMFGAGPYLTREFRELDTKSSHEVLSEWMETFSERHKDNA